MNPGLPAQEQLDQQRRMARRAYAQGRRWILRGVLLIVVAVVALGRGGGLMVTIGVVCWLLAILAISLGYNTRKQAKAIEQKIELMAHGGGPPA